MPSTLYNAVARNFHHTILVIVLVSVVETSKIQASSYHNTRVLLIMFVIFTFMFLYLYPFYMCLFFRLHILCVCLHVLMYVSVFAAVMANKVHHYYYV